MIECDPITPPANSLITYANDKGKINDDKHKYPMGSFVEIQCLGDTVPMGENFLSCTESGTWDYPALQCVNADAQIVIETTTGSNQLGLSTPTSTFNVSSLEAPSKEYWMNLRRFFYSGCSSNEKNKRSEFCYQLTLPNNFTDLTNYESPNTDDFKNMDFKLVSYLRKAAGSLKNTTISSQLNFENLFGYIIYGNLTQRQISLKDLKQSSSIESSFRLVLCFYIDTILLDSDLHITTPIDNLKRLENITQRIKTYLVEIVSVTYRNYKDIYNETSTRSSHHRHSRSTFSDGFIDEYDSYADLDQLHMDEIYEYEDMIFDISTTESTSQDSTESTKRFLDNSVSSNDLSAHTIFKEIEQPVTSEQTEVTKKYSDDYMYGTPATLDYNRQTIGIEISTSVTTEFVEDIGCSIALLITTYKNSNVQNITIRTSDSPINTNEHIKNDFVPIGTKIVLGCVGGYKMKGSSTAICEENRLWSQLNMTCVGMYFCR